MKKDVIKGSTVQGRKEGRMDEWTDRLMDPWTDGPMD